MTSSKAKMWMAYIILLLNYGLIYFVIIKNIPKEKENIVMFILGFLTGVVATIINYYFSSTAASSKKSDTIDKLIKNAPDEIA